MSREASEFASQPRDAVITIDSAEQLEQTLRILDCRWRRRINPGEIPALAQHEEVKQRLGEVTAQHLGRFSVGT
jgi:hypothetical protein